MKRGSNSNITTNRKMENGISSGFVTDFKRRWEAFIENESEFTFFYTQTQIKQPLIENVVLIKEKLPGQTKTPEVKN